MNSHLPNIAQRVGKLVIGDFMIGRMHRLVSSIASLVGSRYLRRWLELATPSLQELDVRFNIAHPEHVFSRSQSHFFTCSSFELRGFTVAMEVVLR
jgi:hypothetical protein